MIETPMNIAQVEATRIWLLASPVSIVTPLGKSTDFDRKRMTARARMGIQQIALQTARKGASIQDKEANPRWYANREQIQIAPGKIARIARIAKHIPRAKQPVMLLGLTAPSTRSRASNLLDSMAVTELGIMFETFNGRSSQSMWSVNPMQKRLTPSEQLLGIMEPAAVSIAETALETALRAWVAAVETMPGITSGFVGTGRVTPRGVILVKSKKNSSNRKGSQGPPWTPLSKARHYTLGILW